jgi:beta-phosphoglucomutase-like phosphatase (HAD superfamily)
MTRATVIRLTAAATRLAVVEHTHTGVKETANAGLISVIGSGVRNLYNGALLNLIWTENPELDTDHGLDIRIWTMNSCWHLSSVLLKGF